MASTYKTVQQNGIKLVMLDDTPQGLEWPADVSATSGMDQKGMGQVAMSILAECIPQGGTVGLLKIDIKLWAANQREDGAREWLAANRPDIKVKEVGFTNPNDVAQKAGDFITANPDVQGLWTPWDGPGLQALTSLRGQGSTIPVTSQDLGTQFALNIANGSQLIGGGAQVLDAQGAMHAQTLIKAMLGSQLPQYVAEPTIAVTKTNLSDAWVKVWGSPRRLTSRAPARTPPAAPDLVGRRDDRAPGPPTTTVRAPIRHPSSPHRKDQLNGHRARQVGRRRTELGLPVIIESHINGVRSKEMNPNTPISYDEIAEDAIRCWEAGACAIHAHNTSFDLLENDAYKDYMRSWDKVLAKHPNITWTRPPATTCDCCRSRTGWVTCRTSSPART